ncbi:hypothetical protein AB0K14_08105 [Actinosynnema sp. NPDC050801]|uniref:hypothetical protein n=1 Tax=unclassified Actinosynnema TaxID=2637065 RepID=UPI0033CB7D3A
MVRRAGWRTRLSWRRSWRRRGRPARRSGCRGTPTTWFAEGRATNVGEWADAGATWWIESDWETTVDAVRDRIAAGPPSV